MKRRLQRANGLASSWRLFVLRRRMFGNPRRRRETEQVMGYSVRLADGPSFYMQYKDEFVRRIYHFESIRPDPLIIDGGGNIGMSVLYFKHVYPRARVVCFEPDQEILVLLNENIGRNHLTNVTIVNAGLSAEDGTADFMPDGTDGGRIVATEGNVKIRTQRLSSYINEPVDFLKLNIEGEELPVLQEAAASGRLHNVRELVVEYHGWSQGEQRLGEILSLLEREGFRYLVHDFDGETCPSSKPPFRLTRETTWFCLVYARRMND